MTYNLQLPIPEEMMDRIREEAEEKHLSIAHIVRMILADYFKMNE